MSDKIIEFVYNSSLQKRPKKLQNNVFVLYLPKRIKLRPEEFINVEMKQSFCLPKQIIATCILLPTLCKNGLCTESFQYISADNNICNASQPINLPWKMHLELANRSTKTVFLICKRQELFPYRAKHTGIGNFRSFFALLPTLKNPKIKILKNEKNCWRYHHLTHVYQKSQS